MAQAARGMHTGEENPKRMPSEAVMHQIQGFTHNYNLTESTPRSLKKFDRLFLNDVNYQIDPECKPASISHSPGQTAIPREFDPRYEWKKDRSSLAIDLDHHRRCSEPQMNKLRTQLGEESSFRPRFRHSSPLINWESWEGLSPGYASLSPRNSIGEESYGTSFKLRNVSDEGKRRLEQLNRKVLLAMETQPIDRRRSSVETAASTQRRDSEQVRFVGGHEHPVRSALASEYIPPDPGKPPYRPLSRRDGQIRLFRLARVAQDGKIKGSFVYSGIDSCPKYTALSYAWGQPSSTRTITIEAQDDVEIGENLWWFLYCRGLTMKKSRLFWIDAICIDQSNVSERNHQVGLMKQIYSTASNVYIWLGRESENSQAAMEFLANECMKPPKRQADEHRPIWDSQEGKAIRDLFERPYWRRMWIIQEIIHANRLTVWCGSQNVDWPVLDRLYLTMKTLEKEDHLPHHEFATDILQSPAFVMVWQRAHWRHPETPIPKLQTLIEVFQGWECADVRDKVYALVSMADQKTAVIPNYSRSPQQIYDDVLRQDPGCDEGFRTLLAQVLGILAEQHD
jgi:hypothetical protein